MARSTHAYLGSGECKMRVVGSAAPFLAIGNASALVFGAALDQKSLKNFRKPGGGTYAQVNRVSDVSVNLTVHDLNGENLARASGGAVSSQAAGTVTDELVVAYKGGTTPLSRPPATITTVEPAGGGAAYAVNVDYVLTPGGINVLSTGAIPNVVAGAPNIQVTYTNTLQTVVQAMVNSGLEYELLFEGLNEAESDLPVIVHAYRVKFAPAQAINFIGDDFAALELTGTSLADANIVTPGISQYWKATIVE